MSTTRLGLIAEVIAVSLCPRNEHWRQLAEVCFRHRRKLRSSTVGVFVTVFGFENLQCILNMLF